MLPIKSFPRWLTALSTAVVFLFPTIQFWTRNSFQLILCSKVEATTFFFFFFKQHHVTETTLYLQDKVLIANSLPTDAIKVPKMSLKAVAWTQWNPTMLRLSPTSYCWDGMLKIRTLVWAPLFWTLSVWEGKYNPPASKDRFLKESFFFLPIILSPWSPERWLFIIRC